MKFLKTVLQNMADHDADNGYKIIYDNIVDNTRWSICHELVFEYDNKFYMTGYRVGATECQDESPYEYDDAEIECQEVKPVEKTITVYEPIEAGG